MMITLDQASSRGGPPACFMWPSNPLKVSPIFSQTFGNLVSKRKMNKMHNQRKVDRDNS